MLVSRVAYDRFVMELPHAEPGWQPLQDAEVAHDIAGWLWQFGPTPLIAIVEHDGDVPRWLSDRTTYKVPWKGRTATALILEDQDDVQRFVQAGAPHVNTNFVWPRVSPAKTFEALCTRPGDGWTGAVDAQARVIDDHLDVLQLQPV